jgi:hypothetical protein
MALIMAHSKAILLVAGELNNKLFRLQSASWCSWQDDTLLNAL